VAQKLEARVVQQVVDVLFAPGEEVVRAEHLVAVGEEPVAEVAPEKAGTPGDENAFRFGELRGDHARSFRRKTKRSYPKKLRMTATTIPISALRR
jgi:hypothetical protein